MRYFKLSSWLDFWPSQKFDFADITGWINFTGDWCQEATCYLCCESCICSWSSLPSLNKWSHWPLWCHHFLLTLLCNCWFISNSSDFSICPNWQAKRTEPFMHTQEGQEGSLVRKERRVGWWGRRREGQPGETGSEPWPFGCHSCLSKEPHPTGCTCCTSPWGRENWPIILIASWVAFISCVFGCKTYCLITSVLLCHGGFFLSSFRMTISHFGHSLVSKCLLR